MAKARKFIIPAAVVLVVAGILIFNFISRRVPQNPADAHGNTTGNLINGGTFCEWDGVIYFSNPYDFNRLYSMSSDCSNISRVSEDGAFYINVYGGYIYYIRDNSSFVDPNSAMFRGLTYGVVRTKLNGSKETTLFSGYCTDLNLTGNELIFNANDGSVLSTYTTSTNGKTTEKIYDGNLVNGSIYYDSSLGSPLLIHSNNGANHSVYVLALSTGNRSLYLDGNTYLATEYNGNLYYIDLDNDYALTCVNLSNFTRTVISKDRVVLYNIYDDVIFIQTENTPTTHGLKRLSLDGSKVEEIVSGDIVSINCTSKYTFLRMYGSDDLYRIPTKSGNGVETFLIRYDTK